MLMAVVSSAVLSSLPLYLSTSPPLYLSTSLCYAVQLFLRQGSEGVDIKEGSYFNIVYNNEISGQMDVNAGGQSVLCFSCRVDTKQ